MLCSLDTKLTDTLHRNSDCSPNSGSTETKTYYLATAVHVLCILLKLFEILAWFIQSGGFNAKKLEKITGRTSSCIF